MTFETNVLVRFGDIDAAGIVFYPRLFEMLNSAIEDWCDRALGLDFQTMHLKRNMGIPVVDIAASFSIPSMLGEVLTVRILPQYIGKSSCRLEAEFSCKGEHRLKMTMTIVCMDLATRRAMPWPPEIRGRIEAGTAEGDRS